MLRTAHVHTVHHLLMIYIQQTSVVQTRLGFWGLGLTRSSSQALSHQSPEPSPSLGLEPGLSARKDGELCTTDNQTGKHCHHHHLRQALGHPCKYPSHP